MIALAQMFTNEGDIEDHAFNRILPSPRRRWLDDEDLHMNWYVLTTIVHCIEHIPTDCC